ncbi:conjugative transposon protein TraN [Chryseobacterium sp. CKR4-1]|uniref:conjugative transposon protein TraN n=1 Tax=Chryseobacterium sp. CKR4-1 TaxID=3068896 RepID=UPI00279694CA|nr:conjugative transposon protein TraN [Chryseobacterium sp. CKR4-1]MDQ1803088.1 conjugative transposon protein TraN [Chryseobacterium sp. CKR4-1]
MKHIFRMAVIVLLTLMQNDAWAQLQPADIPVDTIKEVKSLPTEEPYSTIVPYDVRVTYDKTTHLIFPSAIRYVDLGSENITAGKAESVENVLRVKAAVRGFTDETNFSVVTEDGKFYNFNVRYSEYPDTLTVNLSKDRKNSKDNISTATEGEALFKELGTDAPALSHLVMASIYKRNKRFVRHIGAESFGIKVLLKGIYTLNGKLFFYLEFNNATNIPFAIDFISFKVVDKKISKRTVIQERTVEPLGEYMELKEVAGISTERNVYLLEQLTIPDDKVLFIEIFEKNGGRHQVLNIQNEDLIKARLVKDMRLNF